jgi:tetratricopeptide (TPR) repeat protein
MEPLIGLTMSIVHDPEYQLYCKGKELSFAEVEKLDRALQLDPSDLEVRLQLIGYHANRRFESQDSKNRLVGYLLWLVENVGDFSDFLGCEVSRLGVDCSAKQFGKIRNAWLAQTKANPDKANVLGFAGQFIIWRDYELAEELLNRAQQLDPSNGVWASWLCMFAYFEFRSVLSLYKGLFAEKVLKYGQIALRLGSPAPWMDLEYVGDCALFLGDLNTATDCANGLDEQPAAPCRQIANSYRGRVALRYGHVVAARKYLLIIERGYQDSEKTWYLAKELLQHGDTKTVLQCIDLYKRKIPAAARNRWIKEIEAGKIPNFAEEQD